MRNLLLLGIILAFALAPLAAAEEFSEVEYYKRLAEAKLAEAQAKEPAAETVPVYEGETVYYEDAPTYAEDSEYTYGKAYSRRELNCDTQPANTLVAIPQYFHSRNDKATFKMGGDRLRMSKGHANGMGVSVVYGRRVNEFLSLSFLYQYGFMNVKGGMPIDRYAPADIGGKERLRWHSHVIGFLPEFTLGDFGKLQLSVIQGFDRANGGESLYNNGTRVDRRDINDYGTDVTSLMAWYEKDFQLGCSNWKFTPYAGWRGLYVSVKDANVWSAAPGVKNDDNLWVHLASGGFKLSYQTGALGFNVRGGVSHRTSRDDVPGYGNRAVAPGVIHFSHRANLDKTVGSVGAGVNYVINRRAIIAAGYDGYFGKDTSAHMGTLSFVFPF